MKSMHLLALTLALQAGFKMPEPKEKQEPTEQDFSHLDRAARRRIERQERKAAKRKTQ